VFTTSGTYTWSFVTQIFHSGQPSHVFPEHLKYNVKIGMFGLLSVITD